jgi:predicted Fe-S protein YdhL (DUF1289 family)
MKLRNGKEVGEWPSLIQAKKQPVWRYPVCELHGGRAMCVACMRGGQTEKSWQKAQLRMHNNPRHPYRMPVSIPRPAPRHMPCENPEHVSR